MHVKAEGTIAVEADRFLNRCCCIQEAERFLAEQLPTASQDKSSLRGINANANLFWVDWHSRARLVVRFANDFTDESERLKDILQEAGQQERFQRFQRPTRAVNSLHADCLRRTISR